MTKSRMAKIALISAYDLMCAALRIFALLLVLCMPAHAMKFSPIEMTFSPSGRESVRTFRLENDTSEPVAVEISVFVRGMAADGSDELEPSDDDFIIVPEQMVLDSGDVQWIRVQWIGNPNPDKEMAFRLVAEQLPIDIGDQPEVEGGVIRLLVRYLASVYVVPRGAEADVSVISSLEATDSESGSKLLVDLKNTGTAHKILDEVHLTIKSLINQELTTISLSAEELTELGGRNILAGATRRIELTWPEHLPAGPVEVTLESPAL